MSPAASTDKSSGNKNKKSDKRLAPPPPEEEQLKAPPPSAEVQFLGGRRVHSVENICSSSGGVQVNPDPKPGNSPATSSNSDHLKRSTSMHGHNNAKGKLKDK